MPDLSWIRAHSIFLLAALSVTSGDALAQRGPPATDPAEAATAERARLQMSPPNRHARTAEQRALSAAVRRVESQTGGQVLSAERVPFDGRDVSRIKVVDANGRVRVYMDDPQVPRELRVRPENRSPTRDDDN
ncbi:MAG: hypothetical protein M3Q42_08380 [Pseudomonadota bacterium]|nr:hypothetical protein [Pseudomonadota bacterium]